MLLDTFESFKKYRGKKIYLAIKPMTRYQEIKEWIVGDVVDHGVLTDYGPCITLSNHVNTSQHISLRDFNIPKNGYNFHAIFSTRREAERHTNDRKRVPFDCSFTSFATIEDIEGYKEYHKDRWYSLYPYREPIGDCIGM